MGSNADGNTAVKWKRDEQCCLVTILALLDCKLCSLWSEMDQNLFLLVNALILNSLVNQSCHCHLCIWVSLSVCCLGQSPSCLCTLHHMKRIFCSFNSVYQKCCRANRETVVLQLVNSYCKLHPLYATECLQLSHTAIKELKSAWLCALCEIFHVKDSNIHFISEMCGRFPFETEARLLLDKTGSAKS